MASEAVEQVFKAVLAGIAATLTPYEFVKRGNVYRHLVGGNAGIIEVQRSQSSTKETIRFTLNVGVVYGRLLGEFDPDLSKAGAIHAQLRKRIGGFLPTYEDKWWLVESNTPPSTSLSELEGLLPVAVRFIFDHITETQLIALWETGESPGITAHQRERFLSELKAMN